MRNASRPDNLCSPFYLSLLSVNFVHVIVSWTNSLCTSSLRQMNDWVNSAEFSPETLCKVKSARAVYHTQSRVLATKLLVALFNNKKYRKLINKGISDFNLAPLSFSDTTSGAHLHQQIFLRTICYRINMTVEVRATCCVFTISRNKITTQN